jgi:hypothetical protein
MTEKAKRREKGEVATGMQKPKAVDFEEEGPKKHSEADSMTIEINELYKYKKEDLCIDIGSSTYSNLAYVQASHRDISIDFLEMPGIKKRGWQNAYPGQPDLYVACSRPEAFKSNLRHSGHHPL